MFIKDLFIFHYKEIFNSKKETASIMVIFNHLILLSTIFCKVPRIAEFLIAKSNTNFAFWP